MNFLAHLLLSCEEEELMIGNFLGDFTKNKDLPTFSPAIQRGVRLHRIIDTYTDNHPIVRQGTHRLHQRHGKYAGVVIDVLYDYILANNWSDYGPGSLEEFAKSTYDTLERHLDKMPVRLHSIVPRMIADNWLVRYGAKDGIAYTFSRIQKRVSKPEYLENILISLEENEDQLTSEFALFFPDIFKEVKIFCNC
jgi:acyl carrier protein phosphodiesterase